MLRMISGVVRVVAVVFVALHASVVGTNVPVKPLTAERVRAEAPKGQQAAWLAYLKRSAEQMQADKAVLAKERVGMKEVPGLPKEGFAARAIPLRREAAFYASADARRVGDVVLSFQTPAGGWSKNLAMDAPRQRGQSFVTGNRAPVTGQAGDFDRPESESWHYVGTLDNDATNTELHFLAELAAALPGRDGDAYRASFVRGVEYLLDAQFPNGGWPQVWPLEGGYHDMITFNDDAVVEATELLAHVAGGKRVAAEDGKSAPEEYGFVPRAMRVRAEAAVAKAQQCMLETQIRVPAADGKGTVLTVWGQQHDPLTLEPVSARNYEMPSMASGESARVMEYLMSQENPSPAVVRAVDAAAVWFESHRIDGYVWMGGRNAPGGAHLAAKPGGGPVWARYYSLTTQKPIFGDRDKSIHDDVMEISAERRNGYAWYGTGPARALEEYARWKGRHGSK